MMNAFLQNTIGKYYPQGLNRAFITVREGFSRYTTTNFDKLCLLRIALLIHILLSYSLNVLSDHIHIFL